MLDSDNLLRKSRQLAEANRKFESDFQRFYVYLFTPRIRNVVFSEFSSEKELMIMAVLKQTNSFIDEFGVIEAEIDDYYKGVELSEQIFIQRKHYRLSLKFVYNAISNNKAISEKLQKIKEDLDELHKVYNYKRVQQLSHSIKGSFGVISELLKENNVLISDFQGRMQIEQNLVNNYKKLKQYLLQKTQLQTGDILMSFKTKEFLANVWKSRIITIISQSQVTHVMICIRTAEKIFMADSYEDIGVVKLRDFYVKPGEVFIVLRPRLSNDQRAMILRSIRKYLQQKTKYSFKKVIGIIPTFIVASSMNLFSRGYRQLPNFMGKRQAEIFCSEFVNEVFKDAGILLTPKSGHSNMVFPSDIVASPFVDYVGLVFEDSKLSEEIITKGLENIKI